jgi:RNA polymerase sigma-70 factor (ECF subfamily)
MVQEAILRALTSAEQFTPGTNFRAWIFVILRNAVRTEMRRPSIYHVSLDEVGSREPVARSNQNEILAFCDIRRALCQLSEEHRKALLLVSVDGVSYEEAAVLCGCAVGTIKSRVFRARLIIRTQLSADKLGIPRHIVQPVTGADVLALQKSDGRTHEGW